MNIIKKYSEYIKDNPHGYWFKRKLWGWGWTPVTWQGWVAVIVAGVFVVWRAISFENSLSGAEPTVVDLFWFIAQIVATVLILIIISWKTGEPPKWQWGFPKKEDTNIQD